MRIPPRHHALLLCLLAGAGLNAAAQPTNDPVQSVEVRGAASAADERRNATASKVVVSREEVLRYGDSNLSEVLKRVPGVTVSNAGAVQMRGLGNGYTQILLNGEATPTGFAIDSIAPELIERIEVLRSATAEFGTQAIAGTINIVLKKSVAQAQRELKLALADSSGRLSPSAAIQLADKAGGFSYTVSATLQRQQRDAALQFDESGVGPDGAVLRHTQQDSQTGKDEFNLAPRLSWALADGDSLASQSFLSSNHIRETRLRNEQSALNTPSEFPLNRQRWDAYTNSLRSDLNWLRRLGDSARLDLKFGVNLSRRHTSFDFQGFSEPALFKGRHQVVSGILDQSVSLNGKYSAPYIEDHALVLGWDGSLIRRGEDRVEQMSDALGNASAASNEAYQARVQRLALFVQDEWDISPRWSASLGLRWEGLQTSTDGNVLSAVDNRSGVFSPLLQSVWKLAAAGGQTRQVRLALTRTYKAPATFALIPRRYTVDNNNSQINPDNQGNPALRPELAWGLDGTFEHYFGAGGLLSAGAYLRQIDDVILDRLSVSNGVWTNSPANSGRAQVRGVELELRLPLQSVFASAPALEVRANLNRNWSRVESVPGPDNRLDRQVPLSANLALDYKFSPRLALGGNLNYQRGGAMRLSATQRSSASSRQEFDGYALWNASPHTQWRLTLANLLPQERQNTDLYQDAYTVRQLLTTAPSYRTVRLTLEHKF